MTSAHRMDVDEFLNHTSSGGGRAVYFRTWKKDGKATIWLNKEAGFIARWAHAWPRIVEMVDRNTNEKRIEVWGGDFVCHERELVCKKQNYRDEHNAREYPPEVCPICIMIEHVRAMVERGDLKLWDPVFRFKGSTSEHDVVLTAGGLYNAFQTEGRNALSDAMVAECKKHGVRFKDAWKENTKSRCGYTFVVVDDAHPETGLQISDEREALGQKMSKAIRDEIDRRGGGEKGRQLGNPLRNPYPFKWEYNEVANFDDKYRVVALTAGEPPITPEIEELINASPPASLDRHLQPGNVRRLRADMERCAVIRLPFDEIFEEAEKRAAKQADADYEQYDADDGDNDDADNPLINPKAAPAQSTSTRTPEVRSQDRPIKSAREQDAGDFESSARKPAPKPATKPAQMVLCDACDGEMSETDSECPHCGAQYSPRGELLTRPCSKCKTQIDVDTKDERVICSKCGTVHIVETWEVVQPPQPEPMRRSRSQAQRQARPQNEDEIPFGGAPSRRGAR